ncbi:hydrophobin-3 precursor [Pisolithus marmoratus]|nr:hydrophobin-3 precursor [Pisolithus marmoratus]
MFSRVFTIASLAALAFAGPLSARGSSDNQCNTGTIQCCNQVQQASTYQATLNSIGLASLAAGVTGLVGSNCSPISALSAGTGAQCNAQTVCCTGDQFNGLVNIGCMPINVNA